MKVEDKIFIKSDTEKGTIVIEASIDNIYAYSSDCIAKLDNYSGDKGQIRTLIFVNEESFYEVLAGINNNKSSKFIRNIINEGYKDSKFAKLVAKIKLKLRKKDK